MRTGDRGAALDLLSIEHDNIRAALRWSIDNGELDHVARIGATMGNYWLSRGLALEGLGWTRQILAVIPDTEQATQATFLTWAGYLQRQIGDYESAKHDSERALAIRRRLDDTRGMISTLNALAIICDDMGEYEAEKAYLEEALDLATQLETLPTHVLVANLGWTAWKSDDMQAAKTNFQAAIDQAEAVDGPNIDDYLWGLAWVAWVERDFAGGRKPRPTRLGSRPRPEGNSAERCLRIRSGGICPRSGQEGSRRPSPSRFLAGSPRRKKL